MKPEEWKAKRQTEDVVGSKALKSVIDDYENKLCLMHTEALVMKADIQRYKEEIVELKRRMGHLDKDGAYTRSKNNELEGAYRAEVKKQTGLQEAISAEWYKRGLMLEMLNKNMIKIAKGW